MFAALDLSEFHTALLLIALGGCLLLFSREWPVKLAGCFLLLARFWFWDLASYEWGFLGIVALVAVMFIWAPRRWPFLTASTRRGDEAANER
jgi:hypothetical protein